MRGAPMQPKTRRRTKTFKLDAEKDLHLKRWLLKKGWTLQHYLSRVVDKTLRGDIKL